MKIIKKFMTKNDCYKLGNPMKPKGLMLHSVGCPQPNPLVFWNNQNKSGVEVAVHAYIGAEDTVYQYLPWDIKGWHAGGKANSTHIGVEMTEPAYIKYKPNSATFTCSDVAAATAHAEKTYKTAVELFAFLCKEYGLNPLTDIIGHAEGYKKGVASNHGDPAHLWKQLGMPYTMDTFRADVKELLNDSPQTSTSSTTGYYRVRKSWEDAKSQLGAFKKLEYAKNLADKNKGYYVFDDSGKAIYPIDTLSVGDVVKLKPEATVYNKKTKFSKWVYNTKLYVRQIKGDRVVVSILKIGAVTGSVKKEHITKI